MVYINPATSFEDLDPYIPDLRLVGQPPEELISRIPVTVDPDHAAKEAALSEEIQDRVVRRQFLADQVVAAKERWDPNNDYARLVLLAAEKYPEAFAEIVEFVSNHPELDEEVHNVFQVVFYMALKQPEVVEDAHALAIDHSLGIEQAALIEEREQVITAIGEDVSYQVRHPKIESALPTLRLTIIPGGRTNYPKPVPREVAVAIEHEDSRVESSEVTLAAFTDENPDPEHLQQRPEVRRRGQFVQRQRGERSAVALRQLRVFSGLVFKEVAIIASSSKEYVQSLMDQQHNLPVDPSPKEKPVVVDEQNVSTTLSRLIERVLESVDPAAQRALRKEVELHYFAARERHQQLLASRVRSSRSKATSAHVLRILSGEDRPSVEIASES